MSAKRVWIIIRGSNLNHDGEEYEFYATTNGNSAHKLIKESKTRIHNTSDIENGDDWNSIITDKDYVFIIWLNECSRIYAGNEIMTIVDDEHLAKVSFHNIWKHQSERWDFDTEWNCGVQKEPIIDFSNSKIHAFWRNNGGDCEQTIGIAKLNVNDYGRIENG